MKYRLEIIAVVAVVVFAALFLLVNAHIQGNIRPGQEPFSGTDDAASKIIEETGYRPWIAPIWTPPGNEVESLLFSLEAALGALVIGYFFGYYKGKKDGEEPKEPNGR